MDYEGQTYFFCQRRVLLQVSSQAVEVLGEGRSTAATVAPSPAVSSGGTEYVCPMHPEIVRSAPGSCPICGMRSATRGELQEEKNHELAGMTRASM